MMTDSKDPTHTAFILKREGRRYGKWLPSGTGRLGSDGVFKGSIDSLPVGGFTGYIYFAPIGQQPPYPEPPPQRPGQPADEEE
jgi:hypothetical protein